MKFMERSRDVVLVLKTPFGLFLLWILDRFLHWWRGQFTLSLSSRSALDLVGVLAFWTFVMMSVRIMRQRERMAAAANADLMQSATVIRRAAVAAACCMCLA